MTAMKCFPRFRWAGWLLAVLWLAGCATGKVNWAARVGQFTHDEAIVELGPPDKQARLTDGSVVAEWLTKRGRSIVYSGGAGYYGTSGYYGGIYPGYLQTGPDYFLRLTFGADGRLTAWKRFTR